MRKIKFAQSSLVLSEYKDIFPDEASVELQLQHFVQIAAKGHVFLQHSRRKKQPPKILLRLQMKDMEPAGIYWGSGSRHIDIPDASILLGCHTRAFKIMDDKLDDELCFSVVSSKITLNLQSMNKFVTQFWVQGLSKLFKYPWRSGFNFDKFNRSYEKSYVYENSDSSYDSWDDETHVTRHFKLKSDPHRKS